MQSSCQKDAASLQLLATLRPSSMNWEIIDAFSTTAAGASPASRGQSEERLVIVLEVDEHESVEGLKRITGIRGTNRSEMFDLMAQYLEPSGVALCCLTRTELPRHGQWIRV